MTDITFQAVDYDEIRNALYDLYGRILVNPGINEVNTCGKQLGMWHNKAVSINNNVEETLLMDYRIFSYRPNGFNMAEKYLRLNRDNLSEFDQALLEKMSGAYFAIYQIEATDDTNTITVSDVFDYSQFTLVDHHLAKISVGIVIASHIIEFGEFSIPAGPVLPMDKKLILDNGVFSALESIYADHHVHRCLNLANNAKLAQAIISASIRLGHTNKLDSAHV